MITFIWVVLFSGFFLFFNLIKSHTDTTNNFWTVVAAMFYCGCTWYNSSFSAMENLTKVIIVIFNQINNTGSKRTRFLLLLFRCLFLFPRVGENQDLLPLQAEKVTKPKQLPRPRRQFPQTDDGSKKSRQNRLPLSPVWLTVIGTAVTNKKHRIREKKQHTSI